MERRSGLCSHSPSGESAGCAMPSGARKARWTSLLLYGDAPSLRYPRTRCRPESQTTERGKAYFRDAMAPCRNGREHF